MRFNHHSMMIIRDLVRTHIPSNRLYGLSFRENVHFQLVNLYIITVKASHI